MRWGKQTTWDEFRKTSRLWMLASQLMEGLGDSVGSASLMTEWAVHRRKMNGRREALGVLPNMVDEGLCHLKRGTFSRTCFDTCVIPVRSIGPEPR